MKQTSCLLDAEKSKDTIFIYSKNAKFQMGPCMDIYGNDNYGYIQINSMKRSDKDKN